MSEYPIPFGAIDEALGMLLPRMDTPKARVMLYAIGLQESRFKHRFQIINSGGKGPARGFWQFEQGGGCRGVVNHVSSRELMRKICERRGVQFSSKTLWEAIEHDDVLAAAAARLLLYTDPFSLPAVEDSSGAWDLYMRVWRPGKPHRHTWDDLHRIAVNAVSAQEAL